MSDHTLGLHRDMTDRITLCSTNNNIILFIIIQMKEFSICFHMSDHTLGFHRDMTDWITLCSTNNNIILFIIIQMKEFSICFHE